MKLKHFFLTLFCFLILATQSFALPFNQIVLFGDSLSDNGNLYNFLNLKIMPKSPPYFSGEFSNGPVWSDVLSTYFQSKNIQTVNYAIGGETTILHDPFKGFLPYTVTESIDNYFLHTLLKNKSQTLFIIWIGGNDYLNNSDEANKLSSNVVNAIKTEVERIIASGGKYFLILNLPDLGKTPSAISRGVVPLENAYSTLHNTKLFAAVNEIQKTHKDVQIQLFSAYDMFNLLINNLDEFNQKYHTHFSNTTGTCWPGGYRLQLQTQQEKFTRVLAAQIKENVGNQQKANELAHHILNSPSLSEAYAVQESYLRGDEACKNPDDYVFWDHVHPTAVVHQVLAGILEEFIEQNYKG